MEVFRTAGNAADAAARIAELCDVDAAHAMIIVRLFTQDPLFYDCHERIDDEVTVHDVARMVTLPDGACPRCRYLNAQEWNDIGVEAWSESTPLEVAHDDSGWKTFTCEGCGGTFRAKRRAHLCGCHCGHIRIGQPQLRKWVYARRRELAIGDAER
jgi:hypothetical protein